MKRDRQGGRFAEGHIGWFEAAGILLAYDVTKAFLAFPERMARGGMTAGWSIPIFSALVSAVWLWPLVIVMRSHPGENLIEVTRSLAGRWVAALVGLAYYVYAVMLGGAGAREITSALKTVVLPLTPSGALMSIGLAVTLYVAYHGVEVLGRLCVIVSAMTVAVVVLLWLMTERSWNARLLFPLLGPGPGRLALEYVTGQANYGELLALGIIAAYLRDPAKEAGKAVRWCLGVSALSLALATFAALMLFPYPSLNRVSVPFLRVSRLVYLGRFVQRLDALFVLVWLSAGIAGVSVGYYIAGVVLATVLGLRTYKPLVVASGLIGSVVGWLIPDYATAIILDFDVVRRLGLILVVVWPVVVFLLDLWKGRRGREIPR